MEYKHFQLLIIKFYPIPSDGVNPIYGAGKCEKIQLNPYEVVLHISDINL